MTTSDVISIVSLVVSGLSFLLSLAGAFWARYVQKWDRYRHWVVETSNCDAMYVVGQFKQRCDEVHQPYAKVFQAHMPVHEGGDVVISADALAAVEKARNQLRGIWSAIRLECEAGLFPWAGPRKMLLKRAGNCLKLIEPLDEANWLRIGKLQDRYDRPGLWKWLEGACHREKQAELHREHGLRRLWARFERICLDIAGTGGHLVLPDEHIPFQGEGW
jgi:hypothetical protein